MGMNSFRCKGSISVWPTWKWKWILFILPKVGGVPGANGALVKLNKSLHGLREAPKLWYSEPSKIRISVVFQKSKFSDCLYTLNQNGSLLFIIAYVDDLLLVGNIEDIDQDKNEIANSFTITELGKSNNYLGLKIEELINGLFLSQSFYAQQFVDMTNLGSAKAHKTPFSVCLYEPIASF